MASSHQPHAFNPVDVPTPPPTYSQACITPVLPTSKLITLAGQTGLRSDGTIPAGIKSQAKGAYEAVRNCLKAVGATPRDIIHVRHYIVRETGDADQDVKDVVDRGWGELWIEFMNSEGEGHLPPDTVVGVAGLAKKGLLYEVEVWAMINK